MEKITKFLILTGLIMAIGTGCKTTECAKCPPETVYTVVVTPFGPMPLEVPEGFFNDPENYFTEEQMKNQATEDGSQKSDKSREGRYGI
ncbi:MAG: hypothetical protein JW882_09915 [Deltaproteobacteria bacterium]|nr:hypothetical protein [Deltaproteobacteria bacterium]